MCRFSTHAMPVVGVCLLAGIAPACAVRWAPPEVAHVLADTTALGNDVALPLMSMWPGESRRIVLPAIRSKRTSARRFQVEGHRQVTFRLDERGSFSSSLSGTLMVPMSKEPVVSMIAGARGACTLRVDSLAEPGDTLWFSFTVSNQGRPRRLSIWRARIAIEMPPLLVDGFATSRESGALAPNPFNPSTTMRFVLPTAGRVTLEIFDVGGERVTTLVDGHQQAGAHSATWNGRDGRGNQVGSGVYFGRLTSSGGVTTYKLTLVK